MNKFIRIFYVIGILIVALVIFLRALKVSLEINYEKNKILKEVCPITGLRYRTINLSFGIKENEYKK